MLGSIATIGNKFVYIWRPCFSPAIRFEYKLLYRLIGMKLCLKNETPNQRLWSRLLFIHSIAVYNKNECYA